MHGSDLNIKKESDNHAHPLVLTVTGYLEEVIGDGPFYIVDVVIRGHSGGMAVDVFMDTDEGINLDQCAEISRELGFLLETENVIPGKYQLNVSSPGTSRPLTMPRQFRKNIGRLLKVSYGMAGETPDRVEGTLKDVTDSGIRMEVEGVGDVDVPFERIVKAKIKLPW